MASHLVHSQHSLQRFGHLTLCYCHSFNQYHIKEHNRLFTIIGELHYVPGDQAQHIQGCKGNYMVDDYVRLLNEESKKTGKKIKVFLELNPNNQQASYASDNIWRLEQLNNWLVQNGEAPIEYERVDIRSIHGRNKLNDYIFDKMYDKITLQMLCDEQKNGSYLLSTLIQILDDLLSKDHLYEKNYLLMMTDMFRRVVEMIDSILPLLNSLLKTHALNKTAQELLDQKDHIIDELIHKYMYIYTSVVDLYAFAQAFRNDYKADHIIYLVGVAHAYYMKKEFEQAELAHNTKYHVYEGRLDLADDALLDASGSFY